MEVSAKNLWLQILLNRWRDSCMRFWKGQRGTGSVSSWHVCLQILYSQVTGVPTHHFIVLYEHHVVCAESSAEDDAGHTLETMDPLLSLWPLAAHIEHPVHNTKSEQSQSASFFGVKKEVKTDFCSLTWSATLCRRTVLQWYQLFWLEIAAHPARWGGSLACRFCPFHWGSWWCQNKQYSNQASDMKSSLSTNTNRLFPEPAVN